MSNGPRAALGTKADTLAALAALGSKLEHSRVPALAVLTRAEWARDAGATLGRVRSLVDASLVAVRSSCDVEDTRQSSQAGVFASVLNVDAGDALAFGAAVARVLASYPAASPLDQVLVQSFVANATCVAVVFTRDPATRAPYTTVNYHVGSGTAAVTSGAAGAVLETYVRFRGTEAPAPTPALAALLLAVDELMAVFDEDALDVEIVVDADQRVQVLQVRPLAHAREASADVPEVNLLADWIAKAKKKVEKLSRPHPHLRGTRSIFGVMPDWNPAEMIGVKPRPLALSTYKELITDRTWSLMRGAYGYRDLTGFPLLVSILGVPLIDVRVSFNSFVPGALADGLAEKLVNVYVDRLVQAPHLHDKVEFDIVLSCFFPGIRARAQSLLSSELATTEIDELVASLRDVTARIAERNSPLLRAEEERLEALQQRHAAVMRSPMSLVDRIYWLLEDCRRFGTLAFCGLARAGFVAVQCLRGCVTESVLSQESASRFMRSLSTVATELSADTARLSRGELAEPAFLARYGHLRPGTYDILSRRYDEAFGEYFGVGEHRRGSSGDGEPVRDDAGTGLGFNEADIAAIGRWLAHEGLAISGADFAVFLRTAIEGRERAKFLFTRNISDAFVALEKLGEQCKLTREDLSWLTLPTVLDLYATLDALDLREIFVRNIEMNRRAYETTAAVRLPELVRSVDELEHFHVQQAMPNFVGKGRVVGDVVRIAHASGAGSRGPSLHARVVCLPSADPGYDWVFTAGLAALVTTYGGANSHMAIRAAELGVPAVIGCGEGNAERWFSAHRLEIDCAAQIVRVVT